MEVVTTYTENVFIARFEGIAFHSLGPMTAYNWCTGSNYPAEVRTEMGDCRLAFNAYLGAPTSAHDSRVFVEISGYSLRNNDVKVQFVFETLEPSPIETAGNMIPSDSPYARHEPYWSQTEPLFFSASIWERICFPTKRKGAIVMTVPMAMRELRVLTLKITMRTLIETRQRSISYILATTTIHPADPSAQSIVARGEEGATSGLIESTRLVKTEDIANVAAYLAGGGSGTVTSGKCLKLQEEIAAVLFDETSCDVIILCPSHNIEETDVSESHHEMMVSVPAHSFILKLRSEVFRTMLLSSPTAGHPFAAMNTHVVHIEDFLEPVIRAMVRFLYTDSVSDKDETEDTVLSIHHVALFRLACRYQILGLQVLTVRYMISILSKVNAISFLRLADEFSVQSLKDASMALIHRDMRGCLQESGLLLPTHTEVSSDISVNHLLRSALGDSLLDELLLMRMPNT